MAHEIMGNAFYSLRKPAWHDLGIVGQEEQNILDVAEIVGIPEIFQKPVFDFLGNPIDNTMAIHATFPATQQTLTYGIVSDNRYFLSSHKDVLSIAYDVVKDAPVETMGLLYDGREMFLLLKLPEFKVVGDALRPYLLLVNPLDGRKAIRARYCCTRVVCDNTKNIALGEKTEYKIALRHGKNHQEKLRAWLANAWLSKDEAIIFMTEFYTKLYDTPMSNNQRLKILEKVYPNPDEIDEKASDSELAAYIAGKDKAREDRQNVLTILSKSPTLTSDMRGNAYGLLESIVEYEDYSRPYRRAISSVFGAASERKEQAALLLHYL